MPLARQLCTGASKWVRLSERTRRGKVDCPGCSLALPVERKELQRGELFGVMPVHVGVGFRDEKKNSVDWSSRV